ncbi:meprin A subunit beta-like isoform X2 [Gadus chalcogrammus]|uniref:meprin A subunit beta-like isoform X2 n=1 Tax=Gadus chalcogrammus TaxID=1042646 RepID=UPI0024C4C4B5|nr:meprin A subunit beta-like isoform X2 [Gadus chalcogrammus]
MLSGSLILVVALTWYRTVAKLSGETEIDVDEGQDWDIFDVNKGLDLLEGDIESVELANRNSIVGDQYRWPKTIPYYIEESVEMNAKGVILKAFEQYRLKTCIDFTPWKGEENYISVFKGSGCSSFIGNRRVGKQRLSIGRYCDRLGTVEHEFLHALGFWHEQSRADRDDYVNIVWDQIEPGKAHNFNKYDDKVSSSLGVPYDYGSVMHYSKRAFSIASAPTIVTKIPEFMNVIGQRIEISDSDLLKLNRLYNCTTSSTFVESCDFEELNICGMIQGPNNKWEQRMAVSAGPQTDFTSLGQCKGKGYFMHFSTALGCAGDSGFLESRFLYPKPGVQCLQFFLYSSGGASDSLKMWVREYDELNPQGRMTLFETITGSSGSWELHHVTLNITKKSRVVFEGVKGDASATLGGLSLDDVNIWSGQCPQHVWKIRNITSLLATTPVGTKVYSPSFLSPTGYSFQVGLYLNGLSTRPDTMALFLYLTSGPNDDSLKWPCPWHQATMSLMDQQSDVRTRMNMQRMVTTDPNKKDGLKFFWDRPSKVGSLVSGPDGSYYRGPGTGTSSFLTHSRLHSRKYIKGDDAYFLLSLQDISQLLLPQPLPPTALRRMARALAPDVPLGANKGQNTLAMALTLTVSASLLLVALVISIYMQRRKRTQQTETVAILEGMPGFMEQEA